MQNERDVGPSAPLWLLSHAEGINGERSTLLSSSFLGVSVRLRVLGGTLNLLTKPAYQSHGKQGPVTVWNLFLLPRASGTSASFTGALLTGCILRSSKR